MGTDSKLYNVRTQKTIDTDRYSNLINNLSDYKGIDNRLINSGVVRDELIELCDELISLSMLSTDMLRNIRNNLALEDVSDKFILIDDNDNSY